MGDNDWTVGENKDRAGCGFYPNFFILISLLFELVLRTPICEVYRYRYYLNNAGNKNKA